MSLFQDISGRGTEDISTEIISYLLSMEYGSVPFQKLFFGRVLKQYASSAELNVEIRTQQGTDSGRPDLCLIAEKSLLILENKLGAYLSGDDQLTKYCNVFNTDYFEKIFGDIPSDAKKYLVLLAPQVTINRSRETSDTFCKRMQDQSFDDLLFRLDIKFVPLSWELLISDLDAKDSMQRELILLVQAFLNAKMTKEEKMLLSDPQVPAGLQKVYNAVTNIKEHVKMQWQVGRTSQSYQYFGFDIKCKGFGLWFGFFLPLWQKYKTPIFLQIRKEWISDNVSSELLFKQSRKLDFRDEEGHDYVKPFLIDADESWKDELFYYIKVLEKSQIE